MKKLITLLVLLCALGAQAGYVNLLVNTTNGVVGWPPNWWEMNKTNGSASNFVYSISQYVSGTGISAADTTNYVSGTSNGLYQVIKDATNGFTGSGTIQTNIDYRAVTNLNESGLLYSTNATNWFDPYGAAASAQAASAASTNPVISVDTGALYLTNHADPSGLWLNADSASANIIPINTPHLLSVQGNLMATSFSGIGSNITALTAANLTGVIPIGLVSTGLSSIAGPFLTTNGAARSYSYNGGALSNLNASVLSSGTASATVLPGVAVLSNANTFTAPIYGTSMTNSSTLSLGGEVIFDRYLVSTGAAFTIEAASGKSIQFGTTASQPFALTTTAFYAADNGADLGLVNQFYKTLYTSNVIAKGTIVATNGVFGAYGCMTMSTGTVVVATSASTNLFTAFSYVNAFGGIGSLTNTSLVTTNAGAYRTSFGCSMLGGNGDQVKTLLITNDVVCTLIMFEKTMQSPAIAETGFKEVVVNLPANCRVGLGIANLSATATSIQNLCFNVKGAN